VVAVSQSGRTPEITDTVMPMSSAGAVFLSVTHDQDSELALESDGVDPVPEGEEVAVPATKTVTASIRALTHAAVGYAAAGPTYDDVTAVLSKIRRWGLATAPVPDVPRRSDPEAHHAIIRVPAEIPEPLVAILLMVRAQQLACLQPCEPVWTQTIRRVPTRSRPLT
jgi:hypothetical protein